jgi:GT2 family glycosyltransferase
MARAGSQPGAGDRPRLAREALEALRGGDAQQAWILADRLVRTTPPHQGSEALLLRAAALRRLGEPAAADEDVARAAHHDPLRPIVNRALLTHSSEDHRLRGARRLLASGQHGEAVQAWAVLLEQGFDVVGRLALVDGQIEAHLAWRGTDSLTLSMLTDRDEHSLTVVPADAAVPAGFDHATRLLVALPPNVAAAALKAPGRRALFEPSVLHVSHPPLLKSGEKQPPPGVGLIVVVPVYDDLDATRACLDSILAAKPFDRATRIIVVDDVTPDPLIAADLDRRAASGSIALLRNSLNLGFAASVNRALAERPPGWDALLLNADTWVPPGAIDRLLAHLARPDIGTVTPLSNNGEDTSIPVRFQSNPLPPVAEIKRIDAAAAQANRGLAIDLPNGIGFCLLIRGRLLDAIGPLSHAFGRGYYEDVEFCLRAEASGQRNVCAADVFVGHHGGRSFAGEKRALVAANLKRLADRFPDFRARSQRFEREDPLRPAVERLELALLHSAEPFDLLVLPESCPTCLSELLALASASGGPPPLLLHRKSAGGTVSLRLSGAAGARPQSIGWRLGQCDADGISTLLAALTRLPIRSILLPETEALPPFLQGAVAARSRPIRTISIEGNALARALAGAERPELRSPRRGATTRLVALHVEPTPEEERWVSELAARLPLPLATVLVGARSSETGRDPAALGPVSDEELPAWLSRFGASGILFASARWSAHDPRAWLWAAAGLPTARRASSHDLPLQRGRSLGLPRLATPDKAASVLAAWAAASELAVPPASRQHPMERLLLPD